MAVYSPSNLFPGINPHLNSRLQVAGGWDSFHAVHISHLTTLLRVQLHPMGYTADIEQSLQIRRIGDSPQYPISDVTIYDKHPHRQQTISPSASTGLSQLILPVTLMLDIEPEDIAYYKSIVIYARSHRETPVAWIELLSPSNKPGGRDFKTYRDKRASLLQVGLVFIEIDYLHAQSPAFSGVPDYRKDEAGAFPYHVTVIDPRPDWLDAQGQTIQFGLDKPMPTIDIPLNAGDVCSFDLNAAYNKTYNEMLYGDEVDYSQLPAKFENYSDQDRAYIASRMLAILKNPDNIPQFISILPLEEALRQF